MRSGCLSGKSSSPIFTTGMPGCTTWMGVWKTLVSARSSGWPPHAEVVSMASQYCANLASAVFASDWTPACDSSRSEMNGMKSALCCRMYRAAAMRSIR